MKKKFYVEYLEDSPAGGLIGGDSIIRTIDHFRKGPYTSENAGFKRKKDAERYCLQMNQNAGRQVVKLYSPQTR
tara:strand:+ start:1207 stop:1428 length:222 start_codon:yes stop_codon:yes gene_type:complete